MNKNPRIKRKTKIFSVLSFMVLLTISLLLLMQLHKTNEGETKTGSAVGTAKSPSNQKDGTPVIADTFNKQLYSISDPTSIWIVVNKQRPLHPIDYAPTDLKVPNVPLRASAASAEMHMRRDTAIAIENLFVTAKQQGINLNVQSGYRSYGEQKGLFASYVQSQGQAAADRSSAHAGHSEHQTGFAVDVGAVNGVCVLQQCFGTTPEGKWLAAHAYEQGFIIRYQSGKEPITGFESEPWHIRYVGKPLADQLRQTGQTLEEFFGLPPAPTY